MAGTIDGVGVVIGTDITPPGCISSKSPAALEVWSHIDPGGPIGPSSVLFLRKYFSSLARMCFP